MSWGGRAGTLGRGTVFWPNIQGFGDLPSSSCPTLAIPVSLFLFFNIVPIIFKRHSNISLGQLSAGQVTLALKIGTYVVYLSPIIMSVRRMVENVAPFQTLASRS